MRILRVFDLTIRTFVYGLLTVKIVRVYGGCLGTRSR